MADAIHTGGLRPEVIETYLDHLREKGCKPTTLTKYRQSLSKMLNTLPRDRMPERQDLLLWRDGLLKEGYTAQTVNSRISAANSLFAFLDRKDLQLTPLPRAGDQEQPELTRAEYLRLLQAAKLLEKERLYLLVKVFGSIGITVQDLTLLTVEAVQAGKITGERESFRIPGHLRQELLDYAERSRLFHGTIFLTKGGRPLDRTNLTASMKQLCQTAQVAEEKATPRCLRKLCLDTQNEIREQLRRLVERTYDHLLETEELTAGWNEYAKAE